MDELLPLSPPPSLPLSLSLSLSLPPLPLSGMLPAVFPHWKQRKRPGAYSAPTELRSELREGKQTWRGLRTRQERSRPGRPTRAEAETPENQPDALCVPLPGRPRDDHGLGRGQVAGTSQASGNPAGTGSQPGRPLYRALDLEQRAEAGARAAIKMRCQPTLLNRSRNGQSTPLPAAIRFGDARPNASCRIMRRNTLERGCVFWDAPFHASGSRGPSGGAAAFRPSSNPHR